MQFPRMLYHSTQPYQIVADAEARDALLAQGWQVKPFPAPPPEPESLSDGERIAALELRVDAAETRLDELEQNVTVKPARGRGKL